MTFAPDEIQCYFAHLPEQKQSMSDQQLTAVCNGFGIDANEAKKFLQKRNIYWASFDEMLAGLDDNIPDNYLQDFNS